MLAIKSITKHKSEKTAKKKNTRSHGMEGKKIPHWKSYPSSALERTQYEMCKKEQNSIAHFSIRRSRIKVVGRVSCELFMIQSHISIHTVRKHLNNDRKVKWKWKSTKKRDKIRTFFCSSCSFHNQNLLMIKSCCHCQVCVWYVDVMCTEHIDV